MPHGVDKIVGHIAHCISIADDVIPLPVMAEKRKLSVNRGKRKRYVRVGDPADRRPGNVVAVICMPGLGMEKHYLPLRTVHI